jgi:molecular chaperone DnaJ
MDMSDLNSIFESMFGGFGMGGSRSRRSNAKYQLDSQSEITLEFFEAIFGCEKEIKYSYKEPCDDCDGSGDRDKKLSTCSECQGRGEVHYRQSFVTFTQPCSRCQGSGKIVKNPCKSCAGDGYISIDDTTTVKIPAGVDHGNRIRISGRGNRVEGEKRGDLYLLIIVQDDKHFVRDGLDIYIEVPIFFTRAVLGGVVEVPTLRGKKEITIPPSVEDKKQFILKGEGVDDIHQRAKGSLVAQIKIQYPSETTKEQRELLKELEDSFADENSQYETKFDDLMGRMKGWFR